MMRYSLLILSLAGLGLAAAPAFAQTFTVHNPLPVARPDAVIDLPTAAAARSAVIGGELYPVQRIGDRLRLVAPVAANATFKVALSDKAPPPEPKRVQVTLNVQEGGTLKGRAINLGPRGPMTRADSRTVSRAGLNPIATFAIRYAF